MGMPSQIVKRDGRVVPFDASRIKRAIEKCFKELSEETRSDPQKLSEIVVSLIPEEIPRVEQVQDIVERVLQESGEYEAAKRYILYRADHAKDRESRPIPEPVKRAFEASKPYFPTPIQQFQFYDKYSRFNYELGRRETWVETVDRTVTFLRELSYGLLPEKDYEDIRYGILNMRSMPSMRLLAMAGKAAHRNNITIYNCSYQGVDSIDSFVESLVISMCGCGVGYSVESRYVDKLPLIKHQTGAMRPMMVVKDSSEGWADALRVGLETWFSGEDIEFDFSQIRKAGVPLKTKGGRASGPEPLKYMLGFARERILSRQGSKLHPLDAHDIMCAIGSASIQGGVRRTALISLFDYDDSEMRHSKTGDFEALNSQRWSSNNSAVWPSGITQEELLDQFLTMFKARNGEPGIFNRDAANAMRPDRRKSWDFGTNPCGEIVLRPMQFCNLTSCVAREDDTVESLREKIRVATIIGTIQSMATHFPGVRSVWKENCEEERLLGVDVTGQMDCPVIRDAETMRRFREYAVEVNREYAEKLGINPSVAVTTVKPSGNTSVLVNCSSGLHPRWSAYYIRNVRVSAHSPLYKVLRDAGVPLTPENGQDADTANTWVASFPIKSPEGAITRRSLSALDQLNHWLLNKRNWTEHNPSCTVTYKPSEVIDVVKWVWDHRDMVGGLSFLPYSESSYHLMPYEEISKGVYEKLASEFPPIDFSRIYRYEEKDLTTASHEVSCQAGQCDII